MDLNTLTKAIEKSWSKKTSFCSDEWSELNPSIGQCAGTALIVNDYFNGKLVRASALQPDGQAVSHYFNQLNNKEIDLTKDQFPKGAMIPKGVERKRGCSSTREYILSNKTTRECYKLLKEKVSENLKIK